MKNYVPIKILLTQFTGNQADNYKLKQNISLYKTVKINVHQKIWFLKPWNFYIN